MPVQAFGQQFSGNGFEDAIAAHVASHEQNSNALLNLGEGKKTTDPRPPYNPDHPDNAWPLMLHHAAKGELTVGTSLKGVTDPAERKRIHAENTAAVDAAIKQGYRYEPYPKLQIQVLDPVVEKAALMQKNKDLEGQLRAQADVTNKLMARLEALEAGGPGPQGPQGKRGVKGSQGEEG